MEKKYVFEMEMKTRDYECDIQGVVNNANYLHYLEYTRHEFLISLGITFQELHRQRIDAVVSRIDISYKTSLTGGEKIISKLFVKREGIKIVFFQDIFRASDQKLCCSARVEIAVLQDGKLTRGNYFDEMLRPVI